MVSQLIYQNILLCTDYSKDAEASFIHAFDQAVKYNATLHILNVIPSDNPCSVHVSGTSERQRQTFKKSEEIDEQNRLQALGALKRVYKDRCQGMVEYNFTVKVGSPDLEILAYSEKKDIDMIIMGTAGRHESKRLTYIRTAANVSKFANCQVINIGSPKRSN